MWHREFISKTKIHAQPHRRRRIELHPLRLGQKRQRKGNIASFHGHRFRTVKSLSRVDCDESSLGGTSARICGVKSAAENRFYKPLTKGISKRMAGTLPPDAI
jgi:hypothetical protein